MADLTLYHAAPSRSATAMRAAGAFFSFGESKSGGRYVDLVAPLRVAM